jgi:hypothetical protein
VVVVVEMVVGGREMVEVVVGGREVVRLVPRLEEALIVAAAASAQSMPTMLR